MKAWHAISASVEAEPALGAPLPLPPCRPLCWCRWCLRRPSTARACPRPSLPWQLGGRWQDTCAVQFGWAGAEHWDLQHCGASRHAALMFSGHPAHSSSAPPLRTTSLFSGLPSSAATPFFCRSMVSCCWACLPRCLVSGTYCQAAASALSHVASRQAHLPLTVAQLVLAPSRLTPPALALLACRLLHQPRPRAGPRPRLRHLDW